jgi:hypothetical protein
MRFFSVPPLPTKICHLNRSRSMPKRQRAACSQLLSLEHIIWQITGRLSLREESAGGREPSRGGRY